MQLVSDEGGEGQEDEKKGMIRFEKQQTIDHLVKQFFQRFKKVR